MTCGKWWYSCEAKCHAQSTLSILLALTVKKTENICVSASCVNSGRQWLILPEDLTGEGTVEHLPLECNNPGYAFLHIDPVSKFWKDPHPQDTDKWRLNHVRCLEWVPAHFVCGGHPYGSEQHSTGDEFTAIEALKSCAVIGRFQKKRLASQITESSKIFTCCLRANLAILGFLM